MKIEQLAEIESTNTDMEFVLKVDLGYYCYCSACDCNSNIRKGQLGGHELVVRLLKYVKRADGLRPFLDSRINLPKPLVISVECYNELVGSNITVDSIPLKHQVKLKPLIRQDSCNHPAGWLVNMKENCICLICGKIIADGEPTYNFSPRKGLVKI